MVASTATRFIAVVGAALGLVVVGGGVAAAAPGDPIGEQRIVNVTSKGQEAIVAGYTAAIGTITCMLSSGATCAVTGAVMAIATPLIEQDAVCPNDGIRRIVLQDYETDPYSGVSGGAVTEVVSNTCVPA
jgi:hypothetical protein